MAAASALAEKPGRVEKLFLNDRTTIDKKGIYGINIYALGVPHTVIFDDYLPLQKSANSQSYETLFGLVGEDSSMWGVFLEKAFAKIHGNYEHLTAGDPRQASRSLNGSPSLQFVHSKPENTVEFLWNILE